MVEFCYYIKGVKTMLYKKNSEKTLSKELFKNPTSEYRGTPFWAWNDYLTKEELERQIEIFNEMGLGGFHMHVRTGLKNQYLSEEFMGLVKSCVEKAKNENMQRCRFLWLDSVVFLMAKKCFKNSCLYKPTNFCKCRI